MLVVNVVKVRITFHSHFTSQFDILYLWVKLLGKQENMKIKSIENYRPFSLILKIKYK